MAQQQPRNAEAVSADLPPAMAEIKSQSVDEVLAEMNRMPLFMTTLDETDGEGGENMMLEALKAIAYEGTRYEIAENFRQQGNDCARAKQWTDAKEFYDKAIAALKGPQSRPDPEADAESGKVIEVELDEAEEAKKEKVVEEACYVNRALCNLEKSKLPNLDFPPRACCVPEGSISQSSPCDNAGFALRRASARLKKEGARRQWMDASAANAVHKPPIDNQLFAPQSLLAHSALHEFSHSQQLLLVTCRICALTCPSCLEPCLVADIKPQRTIAPA